MQYTLSSYSKIFLAGILSYTLSGCVDSSAVDIQLSETKWLLKKIDGKVITIPEIQKPVFIQFLQQENQVNGFAGCNSFFGTYGLNEEKITIGPLGSTRKMCPDMKTEDELFKILNEVDGYEINGNILFLKTGDKHRLEFSNK